MSKLEQNTSNLRGILNAVNALPKVTEVNLQNKTVIPTTNSQTVKADNGYDGLNTVTVNAIPSNYEDVTSETDIYTSLLSELEETIESLPDAGNGGDTIETYAVIVSDPGNCQLLLIDQMDNGTRSSNTILASDYGWFFDNTRIEQVIKGSILTAITSDSVSWESIGDTTLEKHTYIESFGVYIYQFRVNGNTTLRGE